MAARKIYSAVENRNRLQKIYKTILRLTDKLPKDSVYRVNTEAIICHRLCILRDSETIEDLECRIGCGPLKHLVVQAQAEYELCQKMILWKAWEPLIRSPPPFQWKWPL